VIDKFGFMEPGTLCPTHYTIWKNSGWEWCLTFVLLSSGKRIMEDFEVGKVKRTLFEERAIDAEPPLPQGPKTMDQIKTAAVVDAIENNNHNITEACRELKISRATIYRYIKRFGIHFEWLTIVSKENKNEEIHYKKRGDDD